MDTTTTTDVIREMEQAILLLDAAWDLEEETREMFDDIIEKCNEYLAIYEDQSTLSRMVRRTVRQYREQTDTIETFDELLLAIRRRYHREGR